uniref:Protein kinase domain-containing protein n=1 Tax=Elaeophora elaphi TaxID=1147741 RepID=A0A0R3RFX9_9BILA
MSSLTDFTICGSLGKACSGLSDVFLVKRLEDGSLSALRILPTEKMDYEKIKVDVRYFLEEKTCCKDAKLVELQDFKRISLLSEVKSIKLFNICNAFREGSVLNVMHNHYSCGLPEKAIAQILKNLLLAVQYLHDQRIVHRSIRCSHILLHSTGLVKLTGFRHCVFLRHNELTGTDNVLHNFDAEISDELLWLAPEILRQDLHGYGLPSDVYSIGITICEMANGFPPFSDMDRLRMLFEKSKGTTPRLLDCTTLSDKENMERDQQFRQRRRFSESLHSITDNCLKPLPENRWSVSKLLTHPFVKAIRKNRSFSSLLPDIT